MTPSTCCRHPLAQANKTLRGQASRAASLTLSKNIEAGNFDGRPWRPFFISARDTRPGADAQNAQDATTSSSSENSVRRWRATPASKLLPIRGTCGSCAIRSGFALFIMNA